MASLLESGALWGPVLRWLVHRHSSGHQLLRIIALGISATVPASSEILLVGSTRSRRRVHTSSLSLPTMADSEERREEEGEDKTGSKEQNDGAPG